MKSVKFVSLLLCFLMFSCKANNEKNTVKEKDIETIVEAKGDFNIKVFSEALVVYDPNNIPNGYNEASENGIIRLANGRVILKKVELPKYEREVKLKLKVSLVSIGDPYDRAGSIFIIPNSKKGISPIDIAKGSSYPNMEGELSKYPGIINIKEYEPCVELMRFMTPFGVGYYSGRPAPPNVGKWERDVKWNCDISHLYSLMEESFYLGVWIDTWKSGFAIDIVIDAVESKENKKRQRYNVLPLINTCPYVGQKYPDVFAFMPEGISIASGLKEKSIKNATLYYTTTGHGPRFDGDEFTKKENVIALGDKTLKEWQPWIDSCASYRKWNPSSGFVQEGIPSSDLARSNWCPGSKVEPISIPLSIDDIKTHNNFKFTIKDASKIEGNFLNFWLVSSYIVYN